MFQKFVLWCMGIEASCIMCLLYEMLVPFTLWVLPHRSQLKIIYKSIRAEVQWLSMRPVPNKVTPKKLSCKTFSWESVKCWKGLFRSHFLNMEIGETNECSLSQVFLSFECITISIFIEIYSVFLELRSQQEKEIFNYVQKLLWNF